METRESFAVVDPSDPFVIEAIRQLVSASQHGEATLISLPMLYPSGSAVGVRVERFSDTFVVSDFAFGYREAEQAGCEKSFNNVVRSMAKAYGIEVGLGHQIVTSTRPDQLASAIKTIGSVSHAVVQKVFANAPEWDEEEAGAELYQRLVTLFGRDHVAAKASVVGASSMNWNVAASVQVGGRQLVFDIVSRHHASIYSAVSMFNDLARLDSPPKPVAVVESKRAMGKYLALLSQTASIIEDDVSDAVLKDLAEAA